MIKVRLHGVESEIKKYIHVLKKHFEILNESDIYQDRAPSKYARVYLDVRYNENNITNENELYLLIKNYIKEISELIDIAGILKDIADAEDREQDSKYFKEQSNILTSVIEGLSKIINQYPQKEKDDVEQ